MKTRPSSQPSVAFLFVSQESHGQAGLATYIYVAEAGRKIKNCSERRVFGKDSGHYFEDEPELKTSYFSFQRTYFWSVQKIRPSSSTTLAVFY